MLWSCKLQGAELNYRVLDQEMLVIVELFKHWRHYLKDSMHPVLVLSDHTNLQHFMLIKELSRCQARWIEKLAAFNFIIKHCSKKKNPVDILSC